MCSPGGGGFGFGGNGKANPFVGGTLGQKPNGLMYPQSGGGGQPEQMQGWPQQMQGWMGQMQGSPMMQQVLQRFPGYAQMQQMRQAHPEMLARLGQGQTPPGMADGGRVGDPGAVKPKGKITLTREERAFARAQGMTDYEFAVNKFRMLAMRGG